MYVYWAKVLTDHPKNCDNVFVIQYFGMNFGTFNEIQFGINRAHQLESDYCMQFAHAYTHKAFKMHMQLEK